MDVVSLWEELSYFDGIMFSIWLGILYFGKCYIDNYFKDKPKKEESKKDKRELLND